MNEESREKALEQAKKELRSEEKDQMVIKAVKMLDNLEENTDNSFQAFRDWYSLHFPELEQEIGDDKQLASILSEDVDRSSLESFQSLAEDSTGLHIDSQDKEILEKSIENLKKDLDYKKELEKYIRDSIEEVAPNLSEILGPLLAAKLLELAGGLDDLAKSPASTVQMLGAEKALFRYLGGEGTPPKHGVLFQHDFVSSLPEEERGKMARFLANKAVIAARLDNYGDKFKGEKLYNKAEKKFEELKN